MSAFEHASPQACSRCNPLKCWCPCHLFALLDGRWHRRWIVKEGPDMYYHYPTEDYERFVPVRWWHFRQRRLLARWLADGYGGAR